MKTTTEDFTPKIREELDFICRSLVEQFDKTARACASRKQKRSRIRSVILHGEWDAGDLDVTPSRYHLLVVVNKLLPTFVWPVELAEVFLNSLEGVSAPISLTFETQETMNAKLRDGYALYHRIAEHGVVLYEAGDRGLDLLSVPDQPSASVQLAKAKDFFERDWELTCSFLMGAYRFQLDGQRASCALMLHLAAEQAYLAFMRVHTLQRPYYRTLTTLRELAESIHPELKLPWTEEGGKQSFHYLRIAFTGVRFSDHYHLDNSLLDQMIGRTENLLRMVRYLCRLKLSALKDGHAGKPDKDWLEISTGFQKEVLPVRPVEPEHKEEIDKDSLQQFFHAVWDLEDPACDAMRAVDVLHFVHTEDQEPEKDRLYLMVNVCKERVTHLRNCIYGLFDKMTELRHNEKGSITDTASKGQDEPEECPAPPQLCDQNQSASSASLMDIEEPCFRLQASGEVLCALAHGGLPTEPEALHLMGELVSENAQSIKTTFKALLADRKIPEKPSDSLPPEEAFPGCSSRVA